MLLILNSPDHQSPAPLERHEDTNLLTLPPEQRKLQRYGRAPQLRLPPYCLHFRFSYLRILMAISGVNQRKFPPSWGGHARRSLFSLPQKAQ
jgi:hypothetical protein